MENDMQRIIGVTELQRRFRSVFDEVVKQNIAYILNDAGNLFDAAALGAIAALAVFAVVFIRYRKLKIAIPLVFTGFAEVVIILGIASVSYYMPAFSPKIITLLPSYPMLFAFREVFFDNPDVSFIYYNVIGFFGAGIVLFLLANYRFKRTLTV